jgi:hypothetical protein
MWNNKSGQVTEDTLIVMIEPLQGQSDAKTRDERGLRWYKRAPRLLSARKHPGPDLTDNFGCGRYRTRTYDLCDVNATL